MKPVSERSLANASLILLLAIGLVLLALLVLGPDYAQAGLDGMQPVSLQSGLQANYAADPLSLVIQPIDLRAVEQSIADRTTSTVSSRQQAAAAIEALNMPIFTVTPRQIQTNLPGGSPTRTQQSLPLTAVAYTSTRQIVGSATVTATLPPVVTLIKASSTNTVKPPLPTKPVFSPTPIHVTATSLPTKAPTSTQPPSVIPGTQTQLPSKTNTWTAKPPTKTPTPTAKPPTRTFTAQPPTKTNTPVSYPPPATKTPVKTLTIPPYP